MGAGPAGLTCAWELARLGRRSLVLERDEAIGGLARTVEHEGFRFDIGGHRFFTKVEAVERIWRDVLGDDLLERPRLSRIYYGGDLYSYPLRPVEALVKLGPVEAVRVVASYLAALLAPSGEERNLEQWVSRRFGRRLYEIFFKTYTEKVWGMPCTEISADWAAQRIKNLDLATAVRNAFGGGGTRDGEVVTTLIERFLYPRLGPGMMWERMSELLAAEGTETRTGWSVERIRHESGRVRSLTVERDGGSAEMPVEAVVSTMPLRNLVRALDPPPAPEVLAAAERLRYRDFLTVVLVVDQAEVFPDNWIYVHEPNVRLGRIQNFKSWSPEMVPDPSRTALGLEYFVHVGDDLWTASDEDLADLGRRELATLGLVDAGRVVGSTVVRAPYAYPVYDDGYVDAVATIREALAGIENLQTIGRAGQHRYNNQDHSMVTGLLAARNLCGEEHDVWAVNVEEEYHEEGREPSAGSGAGAGTGRAAPARAAEPTLEEVIAATFARFDPVALGAAIGLVAAAALVLATAVPLLRGGGAAHPSLSLLGHYLLGYDASWAGLAVGAAETLVLGFAFGSGTALLVNGLVGLVERGLRRELELAATIDPLEAS